MSSDEEHLKLLSIFHYVVGALMALAACIPIVHLVFGFMYIGYASAREAPVAAVWSIFVAVAVGIIVIALVVAAGAIATGVCLQRRTHRIFCMIVAGIECLFMPLGTVLGVFTIVVLSKDSVKELFPSSGSQMEPF